MNSKLVAINEMKFLIQYHNLEFLKSKDWLYTIFIRKTNLKLDFLNFNIFERGEYEKNEHFLKILKFCFVQKTF